MPALSPTMEKGNLAKWLKKEGDTVKSGDVIAEIETDKATMEVEAVDEGTLGKILVPEGTADVAVNTPIAVILGDGEDASAHQGRSRAAQGRADRHAAASPRNPRRRVEEAPDAAEGAAAAVAAPPKPRRSRPSPTCRQAPRWSRMTMREALRDAMAEEMRRDENVFVMGEEVAEYQGAYKVTQGLLQEFGAAARGRHADHRARLCRPRRRRGARRAEADRRVHDLQLRHAGDRPDHQFGGQDALHVGRPDGLPRSCSAARTAPPRASPPSTARTTRPGIRTFPGLKVIAPYTAADAKGLLKAAIRDPNPVIFLENEILYGQIVPGAEARRLRAADRQGARSRAPATT